MSLLVLEGVTGAGKSSTVRALQSVARFRLYGEDLTFDDFMTEFWEDPEEAGRCAARRLASILDEIEAPPGERYLLERFHFSFIAVGSDPTWYGTINDRCLKLECKAAVLSLPDEQVDPIRARARAIRAMDLTCIGSSPDNCPG